MEGVRAHVAEFIGKQLAGNPRVHAGDEIVDTVHSFGLVYVERGADPLTFSPAQDQVEKR